MGGYFSEGIFVSMTRPIWLGAHQRLLVVMILIAALGGAVLWAL